MLIISWEYVDFLLICPRIYIINISLLFILINIDALQDDVLSTNYTDIFIISIIAKYFKLNHISNLNSSTFFLFKFKIYLK